MFQEYRGYKFDYQHHLDIICNGMLVDTAVRRTDLAVYNTPPQEGPVEDFTNIIPHRVYTGEEGHLLRAVFYKDGSLPGAFMEALKPGEEGFTSVRSEYLVATNQDALELHLSRFGRGFGVRTDLLRSPSGVYLSPNWDFTHVGPDTSNGFYCRYSINDNRVSMLSLGLSQALDLVGQRSLPVPEIIYSHANPLFA